MSPNKKHIHKYNRIRTRAKFERVGRFANKMVKEGRRLYACVLPDCTHTIDVSESRLLVGKIALCALCATPFFMDKTSITLAKPHCAACKKQTRKEVESLMLDDILGDIS